MQLLCTQEKVLETIENCFSLNGFELKLIFAYLLQERKKDGIAIADFLS